MREPPTEPLALEATALHYAAGDLSPSAAADFEERLAGDQSARDALSEAVRLSAAALGQESPSPDRSFRAMVRERVHAVAPAWLARRAYRGHPLVWAGAGALAVATAALFAVSITGSPAPEDSLATAPAAFVPLVQTESPSLVIQTAGHPDAEPVATDPNEDMRKAAEIWAELSTPDHVEKTHDDEARLQNRFKNLRPTTGLDSRDP